MGVLGGPKALAMLCLRMGTYLYRACFPFLGGEGVQAKVWGESGKRGLLDLFPAQLCGMFLSSLLSQSWLSKLCYISLGPSDTHFGTYYKRYFDGENLPKEEFKNHLCYKHIYEMFLFKKIKFKPK